MRKAILLVLPLLVGMLTAFRPAHEREFSLAWGEHRFSTKVVNSISSSSLQELMLSKPISLFDGNEKLNFNGVTLFIIPRSAEPIPISISTDGDIALSKDKLNELNFEAIATDAVLYFEVLVAHYPDGTRCEMPGISFEIKD